MCLIKKVGNPVALVLRFPLKEHTLAEIVSQKLVWEAAALGFS